jgi:hypothetical protein
MLYAKNILDYVDGAMQQIKVFQHKCGESLLCIGNPFFGEIKLLLFTM